VHIGTFVAPKMYILTLKINILAPKMYILAPKMYILAPNMYILTTKIYILAPKMDKSLPFESPSDSFRTFF